MKTFVMGLALLTSTAAGPCADEAEDCAIERVEERGGTVTRDKNAAEQPVVGVDFPLTQPVDDAVLKSLVALKRLRTMNIACLSGMSGRLSDDGLVYVSGRKELRKLNLNGHTTISDGGLKHLANLPHLEELNLGTTAVTNAGLRQLAGLKTLQRLDLSKTGVTGAGLRHLTGLTNLQHLNLADAQNVTDEGPRHLARMKQLREVDLTGTRVTEEGLAELRKALPQCKVIHQIIEAR